MAKYSDLLKDPRWQKKRLEILQRDNWACVMCGDTEETLHIHHKSYQNKKNPWEVSDDVLETLCESCHEVKEDAKKSNLDLISIIYISHLFNKKQIAGIYKKDGEKFAIVFENHLTGVCILRKDAINDLYSLINKTE